MNHDDKPTLISPMEELRPDKTSKELCEEATAALAEILTGSCVSSEALRFFNVTRFAFGRQLDGAVQVLLDAGEGLPDLQRSLLTTLCVHLIERLLLPPSDAPEIQPKKPRALSTCERPYKEQEAKGKPIRKTAGQLRREWLARMTPEELAAFKAKER
jgi:hypothetical protein